MTWEILISIGIKRSCITSRMRDNDERRQMWIEMTSINRKEGWRCRRGSKTAFSSTWLEWRWEQGIKCIPRAGNQYMQSFFHIMCLLWNGMCITLYNQLTIKMILLVLTINKSNSIILKTAYLSKVYNLPNQEYTNVTLSLFVQVNPVDIS